MPARLGVTGAPPLATTAAAGLVKPDGAMFTVQSDGTTSIISEDLASASEVTTLLPGDQLVTLRNGAAVLSLAADLAAVDEVTSLVPGDQLVTLRNGAPVLLLASALGTSGTSPSVPGQVTGLTVGTTAPGYAPLSWTAPATGGAPTSYTISYGTAGGTVSHVMTGSVATSYTLIGLTAQTTYIVSVVATNSVGNGPASGNVSATTAAPSSTASLLPHSQAYIQPVTIPTSNAVPFVVALTTPNSCVFDATFGTGGTVPDNATLDKVFYFTNDEGDFVNNPASYPSQGASGNWRAVYRHYPAFESDGTTPDPANLHVMQTDHLSLIARTKVASSFDSSPFEMGYLRAPVGLTPGMYMELKCRWPSYSRDGISARWSWPTFWMFSTFQAFGGTSVEYPAHAMETDVFDGYPEDNSRFGSSFPSGTPITPYGGDISQFQPVADVKVGAPGYRPGYSYEPDGTMRLYSDGPAQDPSHDYHVYGFDWRDANNIYFLIDGVVVRHRTITTTAKRSDGSWQPFRIEVSHQYVSLFNPTDYPAADAIAAAGGSLRASYDVQYLRVWNSTTNAVDGPAYAVPALPLGGPTLVNGISFAFRADIPSADQHTAGAGTVASPLVLTSKVVGNNDYRVFFGVPWDGTGTRTILMRPNMPPQDNFCGAWAFYSSTNPANWVAMQNLYPKGYSGYGGCGNGAGTGYNLPDGSGSSYANYDNLGNYIPYYGRITRVGANFIFSASRTGVAGSFTPMALVPVSAITSDYDSFGVFTNAKDNQNYGFPISVELSGFEATTGVDPQAAYTGSTAATTPQAVYAKLLDFTGPAGAPTGNKALQQFNTTTAAACVLDGNGNLVFDSSDAIGVLATLGAQPDGYYRFTVAPGAADYRIPLRSTAGANATAYIVQFLYGSSKKISLIQFTGGSYGGEQYGTTVGQLVAPVSTIGLYIKGAFVNFYVDDVIVGSFNGLTGPTTGLIGVGATSSSFSKIEYHA